MRRGVPVAAFLAAATWAAGNRLAARHPPASRAAAPNHSPLFAIDEPALAVATRALLAVTVDYMQGH